MEPTNILDIFNVDAATEAADINRQSEGSSGPDWDQVNFEPAPTKELAEEYTLRFVKNPFLKFEGDTLFPLIAKYEHYRFVNRSGRKRTYISPRAVKPGAQCAAIGMYTKSKGDKNGSRAHMLTLFKRLSKFKTIVQVVNAPPAKAHYIGRFLPAAVQERQMADISEALMPTTAQVEQGIYPAGGLAVSNPGSAPMYYLKAIINDQGRNYDNSRFVAKKIGLLVEKEITEKYFPGGFLLAKTGKDEAGEPVEYMEITILPTDTAEVIKAKQECLFEKLKQLDDEMFNFARALEGDDLVDFDLLCQEVADVSEGKPITRTPVGDPAATQTDAPATTTDNEADTTIDDTLDTDALAAKLLGGTV